MRVEVLKAATYLSLLAVAGIGAAAYAVIGRPLENLENRPILAWSPGGAAGSAEADAVEGPANYSETLERPLFAATRRPFVPPPLEQPPPPEDVAVAVPPPPPEPQPDAGSLRLKGVLLGGSKAQALIATPDAPNGRWFAIGNLIAGFTLAGIENDRVRLTSGPHAVVLKLYVDNAPK